MSDVKTTRSGTRGNPARQNAKEVARGNLRLDRRSGSGSLGKAKKQGGGGHNWGTWEEDPEEEEKEATEEEVVMETEDGHQPQVGDFMQSATLVPRRAAAVPDNRPPAVAEVGNTHRKKVKSKAAPHRPKHAPPQPSGPRATMRPAVMGAWTAEGLEGASAGELSFEARVEEMIHQNENPGEGGALDYPLHPHAPKFPPQHPHKKDEQPGKSQVKRGKANGVQTRKGGLLKQPNDRSNNH